MDALEKSVRSVEKPGLVWGASKFVPIGFGIRKLQITLVVGEVNFCACVEMLSHGASQRMSSFLWMNSKSSF